MRTGRLKQALTPEPGDKAKLDARAEGLIKGRALSRPMLPAIAGLRMVDAEFVG